MTATWTHAWAEIVAHERETRPEPPKERHIEALAHITRHTCGQWIWDGVCTDCKTITKEDK